MKITIDIADSAYNYFKDLAEDMGCPVETLINNEVEAVHHRAELAKWREEDFEEARMYGRRQKMDLDLEEANSRFLERSFGEDDYEW